MTVSNETLASVKLALRIVGDDFNSEITMLIEAAMKDLGLAGVDGVNVEITDELVLRAVITFVKMSFGEPDEYDRLKRSYDEQKAQMSTATSYTTWG